MRLLVCVIPNRDNLPLIADFQRILQVEHRPIVQHPLEIVQPMFTVPHEGMCLRATCHWITSMG